MPDRPSARIVGMRNTLGDANRAVNTFDRGPLPDITQPPNGINALAPVPGYYVPQYISKHLLMF